MRRSNRSPRCASLAVVLSVAACSPAPGGEASAVDPSAATSTAACNASYVVTQRWANGFQASVTMTNGTGRDLRGWSIDWTFGGDERIANLWNGVQAQAGARVHVQNVDYDAVVPAGGTITLGFVADGAPGAAPRDFALDGAACGGAATPTPTPTRGDAFASAIGTTVIGPSYHFTSEPAVVEAARAALAMGSTAIKIRDDADAGAVFDMPFRQIFVWYRTSHVWYDGFSDAERSAEYAATYAYTKALLVKYAGSGKTFFLGHWEGDWYLLPDYDSTKDPPQAALDGMAAWLRTRQEAIDAAKRDVAHAGVDVFQYAEVNKVLDAMDRHMHRVVNDVLPRSNVDYASYSSYDVQQADEAAVHRALDYIAGNLPPKPGIAGKRVFVGEFGIPESVAGSPAEHERRNREIAIKFLDWGCPFVLYWEMYNNEIKNGKQVGYWLIDDQDRKTPLYDTFAALNAAGRQYVAGAARAPAPEEYARWAATWLARR